MLFCFPRSRPIPSRLVDQQIKLCFNFQALTVIILLERFRCLSAANDLRATVGKSVMKFSERSNFSKFSVPWKTSLLNLDSRFLPRSRICRWPSSVKAPPSTAEIMFPCKSISSKVFCDKNEPWRMSAEKLTMRTMFYILLLQYNTYHKSVQYPILYAK